MTRFDFDLFTIGADSGGVRASRENSEAHHSIRMPASLMIFAYFAISTLITAAN